MKITVAGTSYTGCNYSTCFAEFLRKVNGTYIQTEKMKTLQSDRPLINSSIKELLQNFKPPNVIKTRMAETSLFLPMIFRTTVKLHKEFFNSLLYPL